MPDHQPLTSDERRAKSEERGSFQQNVDVTSVRGCIRPRAAIHMARTTVRFRLKAELQTLEVIAKKQSSG